jgi:hypothetical protein
MTWIKTKEGMLVNLQYVAQIYATKGGIDAVIVAMNGNFKLCRLWNDKDLSTIEDMLLFLEQDIAKDNKDIIYMELLEKELKG